MIPKIIHFVWVGGAPKPDLVLQCINTWRRFCPDYTIMEWGNDCLGEIDNQYVREAFHEKKWAFVSDYIRLWALKKYGGFYFDSDLEITQDIDEFRKHKFVTGYESLAGIVWPFTAFMGAEPGSVIVSELLAQYDGLHFINPDGSYNQQTNTVRVSNYFGDKYGVLPPYDGAKITKLGHDGVIYPSWFFCTPVAGKPNYSIHLFNGSWLDGWNRKTKLKIGCLSIVRFRRVHHTKTIPLQPGEQIILKLYVSFKKFYAIVWGKK